MISSMGSPLSAGVVATILGAALLTGAAMAQGPMPPPNPRPIEVKQGDKTIKLFFRGNAFYPWYEDADGFTVVRDGKIYVYAKQNSRGDLEPMKDKVVGKANTANLGVPKGVRPTAEAMTRAREAVEKKRQDRTPTPTPSGKADQARADQAPGPNTPSTATAAANTGEAPSGDGSREIASSPGSRPKTEVRRADGTTITLVDRGGWYEDPEHYAVVRKDDDYLYAVRNKDGQLTGVPGLLVNRTDPARAGLLKGLRPSPEAIARNQPVD